MQLDPRLFESPVERACRQAGIDIKTVARATGAYVDPALAAAVQADFARAASLLPPGHSAVPPVTRK